MAEDELIELVRSAITTTDAGLRISPEGLRRVLRENRDLVLRELGGSPFWPDGPGAQSWAFPTDEREAERLAKYHSVRLRAAIGASPTDDLNDTSDSRFWPEGDG